MSALSAPTRTAAPVRRPRLRAVPRPPARLARLPFLGVLIAVFGLGMAGLLMLNTTLQDQAFESRTLDRQATELVYRQAALEAQLDQLGAPQELVRRASRLGLRPNPYPAFLVVPSGKVVGQPRRVTGNEEPLLVIKTPAEQAAEQRAREAKRQAKAVDQRRQATRQAAVARAKALAAQRRSIDQGARAAAANKTAAKAANAKNGKNAKKAGR